MNPSPARLLSRIFPVFALACTLAACGGTPRPRDFAPMSYDHLPQIRLNVASVEVDNRIAPPSRDEVGERAPIPPIAALQQMAQDRLKAFGNGGRAVLVIKDASLVRGRDEISGRMAVQLDIYTSDDRRAGFATAEVAQRRSGEITDLRATLYDLTKTMMDRMNVELEFQARRSLRDWILPDLPAAAAGAAAVQQQSLAPPVKR